MQDLRNDRLNGPFKGSAIFFESTIHEMNRVFLNFQSSYINLEQILNILKQSVKFQKNQLIILRKLKTNYKLLKTKPILFNKDHQKNNQYLVNPKKPKFYSTYFFQNSRFWIFPYKDWPSIRLKVESSENKGQSLEGKINKSEIETHPVDLLLSTRQQILNKTTEQAKNHQIKSPSTISLKEDYKNIHLNSRKFFGYKYKKKKAFSKKQSLKFNSSTIYFLSRYTYPFKYVICKFFFKTKIDLISQKDPLRSSNSLDFFPLEKNRGLHLYPKLELYQELFKIYTNFITNEMFFNFFHYSNKQISKPFSSSQLNNSTEHKIQIMRESIPYINKMAQSKNIFNGFSAKPLKISLTLEKTEPKGTIFIPLNNSQIKSPELYSSKNFRLFKELLTPSIKQNSKRGLRFVETRPDKKYKQSELTTTYISHFPYTFYNFNHKESFFFLYPIISIFDKSNAKRVPSYRVQETPNGTSSTQKTQTSSINKLNENQ